MSRVPVVEWMSLGRVRISNLFGTLKEKVKDYFSYLQDRDVEVHALSIDLAL
jgi:hypothetical protein